MNQYRPPELRGRDLDDISHERYGMEDSDHYHHKPVPIKRPVVGWITVGIIVLGIAAFFAVIALGL